MRRLLAGTLLAVLLTSATGARASPPPDAVARKEAGDKLREAGDFPAARRAYLAALDIAPGWASAHNELGSLAFLENDLPGAIVQFRKAVAAEPDFALAQYNLGFASRKSGDFPAAVEAYLAYSRLKPEDPDGVYGLAESYLAVGDRAGAAKAYARYAEMEKRESEREYVEKALARVAELNAELAAAAKSTPATPAVGPIPRLAAPDPALATRKMAEGDAWLRQNKAREALFAYQDAVAADPKLPDALFRVGLAYAHLGYFPEAIQRWQKVIDDPTSSAELRQRARTNLDTARAKLSGKGPGAIPPPSGPPPATPAPDALVLGKQKYDEANALYVKRQYAEAIALYDLALKLRPGWANAHVGRGNAQLGLGKAALAKVDFEQATALAPGSAAPLFGLAMACERLGETARAKELYGRYAVSTSPDATPDLKKRAADKAR